jgi:predicted TIM-barrel fold metal-dependent hydrolase
MQEGRSLTVGETFDTRELLRNARAQADARNLDDVLIVDADAHHYETSSWPDIMALIEDPALRQAAFGGVGRVAGSMPHLPSTLGNQDVSGRITRYRLGGLEETGEEPVHPNLEIVYRAMNAMAIDYEIVFPTPMLNLGLHPVAEVEVAVARAYARWSKEHLLVDDRRIGTMLYLPFSDPGACARIIEDFGDTPGNRGFLVTATRYRGVHHNDYARVYRMIEERGLPIAFHAAYNWNGDRMMETMNRFLTVHALGFCFFNMVHLANWIVNGLPERFPNLKVIWIETGIAWLPFMMQRLDHEFVMRSSEAPLLQRKPSEYMREMYFTSQPLEIGTDLAPLELAFSMMDAENRLLYASDFPHWDFDVPSRIYDLPFLSDEAKRKILGLNACGVFGLEAAELAPGAAPVSRP